jgi:hypothetical protein
MTVIARTILLLGVIMHVVCAQGQSSELRWASRTQDKDIFDEVEAAFSSDLQPDSETGNIVPMKEKFIERLGIRGDSVLVIIGNKESKTDPYPFSRAFSFDRKTKMKVPVFSKNVEVLWMWRLEKVAHLTPYDTDVVFSFFTCTECEATRLLASFQQASSTGRWQIRQWSQQDDDALVIGSDVQIGDEGLYYYDCLHAVRDITGDGLDDVAVRCRERLETGTRKPLKRVTSDRTLLYTFKNGMLARLVVRKREQLAAHVHKALCEAKPKSLLCRIRP